VRHDHRDEEGPVWLEVERLVRKEPPAPPDSIGEWIVVPGDPARSPHVRGERLITVTAGERDAALAKGEVRPDDVLEALLGNCLEDVSIRDRHWPVGTGARSSQNWGSFVLRIVQDGFKNAVEAEKSLRIFI
jgi:hypothetical protein